MDGYIFLAGALIMIIGLLVAWSGVNIWREKMWEFEARPYKAIPWVGVGIMVIGAITVIYSLLGMIR